jgi:phosphoenolpyruvate carboxykinase (ATP)
MKKVNDIAQNLSLKTRINYQLPTTKLVEQCLQRQEGVLNDTGALVICTGEFTGRSPADKFIVKDALTDKTVDWNKFNNPISEASFLILRRDMTTYLNGQDEVWVRDGYACASPAFQISIRIVNECPSSNHFAANMFIAPVADELKNLQPDWTIIQAAGFKANPAKHGTRQGNFTIVSFTHKTILVGGTGYTGEIKKGVFTVLNFI